MYTVKTIKLLYSIDYTIDYSIDFTANSIFENPTQQIIIIEDTSFDRKHWGFNRVFMTFRNPQFHESVKNDLCTCPNDVRVFF